MFRPDGALALVENEAERGKLEGTWYESPADYGVETAPAAPIMTEGGYVGVGYAAPASSLPQKPGDAPAEAVAEVQAMEEEARRHRGR